MSFRDEIDAYEARLRTAMLAGDVATLDALLSDDLLFVNHDGSRVSKAQDLEAHRSGLLKIGRLDLSDSVVKPVGGDAAVVVVHAHVEAAFGGQAFAGDFVYSRVWGRRGDAWVIEAAHCCAAA